MTDPTPQANAQAQGEAPRPTDADVHEAVAMIRRAAWSRTAKGQRAIAAQTAARTILAGTSDKDRLVAAAAQHLIDARDDFDEAKATYLSARDAWATARDELRELTR